MEGLGGERKLALPHGSVSHHPDTAVLLMGQVKSLVGEQRYPTERALWDQRGSARIYPNEKQQQHSLITSASKRHQILCVSWFGCHLYSEIAFLALALTVTIKDFRHARIWLHLSSATLLEQKQLSRVLPRVNDYSRRMGSQQPF